MPGQSLLSMYVNTQNRKPLHTKDKCHLKESRMDRLRVFALFAYIAHKISSAICTALSAAPFFI